VGDNLASKHGAKPTHSVEEQIEWRLARPVDVARTILDIGLAERELNWHPQSSFEDGLRLTLSWMKNRLEG
jgi:nucleoside-diphosphate-sugar epimerase